MQPILPMEPKPSTSIPGGEQWIGQIKWDGVRVLTYYDGSEVRLFNRHRRERTLHYPELTDINTFCTAKSVILDGEAIALGQDGKPSFSQVMRRDGVGRMERVSQLLQAIPVTYMIFDVIYLNGAWIKQYPLQERRERLQQIIVPDERRQIVSSHDDGAALFTAIKEQDMEGIVMKRLDSPYLLGAKRDLWLKIKNYHDLYAVIGGFTLRGAVANSLLLGLYDEGGHLQYVGKAGAGRLSQQDWRLLTRQLRALVTGEAPFVREPRVHRGVLWVQPRLAAKVQFLGWTEGNSLRQPSIQGLVEVPSEECTFAQGDGMWSTRTC